MHEKLFLVGMGLIFLGVLITIISAFAHGKGKVESGGAIFIGPIPIIFGTSERMVYLAVGLSLLMLLLFILFRQKLI